MFYCYLNLFVKAKKFKRNGLDHKPTTDSIVHPFEVGKQAVRGNSKGTRRNAVDR